MNKDKNYYIILGSNHDDTDAQIKKKFYKLSFEHHPDKGGSAEKFAEITEAYNILYNKELREEYDLKSKWGKNYNEYYELFDVKIDFDYEYEKEKLEKFKKNEINNIQIEVDKTFNGKLEYERWVKCKSCDGTGKDFSEKIVIRDNNGNIVKTFDGEDGCDYCEGSGKDYRGNDCTFCSGKGKIGLTPCKSCNGERRILGKQKLNGIKLTGEETKIESMGHFSKDGKVGYLLIIKLKTK
jgi:DnaJ-class molecular chaperone